MIATVRCPLGHAVNIVAEKMRHEVACPQCLTPFLAMIEFDSAERARKEERKTSRSRKDEDDEEDDDDEDEDEPPRKKKAVRKRDDDDDEDDAPRKKKAARKRDDDDEDDEDEDDDEEDEDEVGDEEEEEIEWTGRKRQLNLCSIGLIILMIATSFLGVYAAFNALGMMVLLVLDWTAITFLFIAILAIPSMFFCIIGHIVSLIMNLFIPSRAEARGPIIGGLVFFGILVLLTIFTLLTEFNVLSFDPDRRKRMLELLYWGSYISFALGLVSTMAYLAKLMIFIKLHLESSKPVTNAGFLLLFLIVPILLNYIYVWCMQNIGDWMRFILALIYVIAGGICIRMIVLHVMLLAKIRRTIAAYIRDA
jgi:hypothetical protein